MASSHPSFAARPVIAGGLHLHVSEDICPVCEQEIPHERAGAIAERLKKLEQKRDAEITAELTQRFKAEAEALVATARDEARSVALAEAQTAVGAAEQAKLKAESEKAKGDDERATLKTELEETQRKHGETVERIQQDAAFREAEIRREAIASAEKAATERVTAAEQGKTEAESRATAAQAQLATLQQTFEDRLSEQRDALEAAKTAAVNEERAAQFNERLKLTSQVETLKRALEKKSNEELGEGAHINLLETLKAEFEDDRIDRVGRGQPGADIIHKVMHNGKLCGTIIYDSKNHNAWRGEFVTKLKSDQLAEKADYAILSVSKLPAGQQQLHVLDGVIVACPARVVALVQIVRQQMIQMNTLRMSSAERKHKTAKLYDFITSARCADLFARFDTHSDALLDLQDTEKKAHENVWKRQGILIRSVQKVSAELSREIDSIISGDSETENVV